LKFVECFALTGLLHLLGAILYEQSTQAREREFSKRSKAVGTPCDHFHFVMKPFGDAIVF
jgi:hypothetical protein